MVEGRGMGTEGFEAPEVIEGAMHDGVRADIFAAGVTVFLTHTCLLPFRRAVAQDMLYGQIIEGNAESYWAQISSGYTSRYSNQDGVQQ